MSRSPWRFRKYELVCSLTLIIDNLVFLLTLGYVDLNLSGRVIRWSFDAKLKETS